MILCRATEMASSIESFIPSLTSIEKRSLHRRCELLEQYSDERRSSYLLALSLSSSANTILGLKSNNNCVTEACIMCQSNNLEDFSFQNPLNAVCRDCGVVMNRCCYSYDILDFRGDNMIDISIAEDETYQAMKKILYCPLCQCGSINILEEVYIDDKFISSGESARELFNWLDGYDTCRRCPFCTTSLDFI